jgi:selenide,water dikinase
VASGAPVLALRIDGNVGMLSGSIAGHYEFDDVHIDLRRLAEFAGARYDHAEVIGIGRVLAQGEALQPIRLLP